MNNYKIRVNNEAESWEVQELFFELGYRWPLAKRSIAYTDEPSFIATVHGISFCADMERFQRFNAQELTLPQLRDLVVLHRNDIDDANWETEGDDQIYEDSSGKSFIFREQGWDELQRHEMRQAMWEKTKPKTQTTENEQGLISGADALRALADGEDVLWKAHSDSIACAKRFIEHPPYLALALDPNCDYQFWIKPRTIKLEIEVPAPFEPKMGDKYFFLSSNGYGYDGTTFSNDDLDKEHLIFGAWRTKEEIKIVVEQLRKIKEHSK